MGAVHNRGEQVNTERIAELQRIADRNNGLLLPEEVVKAAKSPKSALHTCFEWDNTKAAQAHRLWQARQLISVTVNYLNNTKETVPMFVSLSSDREKGGGYRTLVSVLSDDEQRKQLLEDAYEDMQTFKRKYKRLEELTEVFEAMEAVGAAV
jgi:hypothetical protein